VVRSYSDMRDSTRIVPPLPDWPRTESEILSELDFRPLGVELWLAVRKGRLWAETAAPDREHLFPRKLSGEARARHRAAVSGAPELREPLHVFRCVSDRSERVDADELARACARIADWAMDRSLLSTACQFALAAAHLLPDNPEFSNLAGLMFRRSGDFGRAEACYPRAIILGQKQRNWVEYICGHIGTAALLYTTGVNLKRAVRHLKTAARMARKEGMLWLAGHAVHDSMLLMLERGDFEGAEAAAVRAAEMYPLHDRRFPFFVADYALVQLMQWRFSDAHRLLKLCLDVIDQPAARGVITSMLARTAAGTGKREEYGRFSVWAREFAEKYSEHAAAAHYHLAEAARACRAWQEAEAHALRAREIATQSNDRMVSRLAGDALALAKARALAPDRSECPPSSVNEELGRVLGIRLRRWSPDEHRGPQRTLFRNQWVA